MEAFALVQAVEVVPEDVAETAELCRALVVEAELECLGCSHGVQTLQLDIAAQNIQDGTVSLPQELEPRCY